MGLIYVCLKGEGNEDYIQIYLLCSVHVYKQVLFAYLLFIFNYLQFKMFINTLKHVISYITLL